MDTLREEIKKEAEKLQINALYSSKGHFAASGLWKFGHYLLGIPLTLLSAATTYFADSELKIISIVILVLSSLITFLNPSDKQSTHFSSGQEYDVLYCKARQFSKLACNEDSKIPLSELKAQLEDLYKKKYELDAQSLKIPYIGYKIAQHGIRKGEASYDENLE